MEDNLTLTLDLSDKYQAYLYFYENYTFRDVDDYGLVYVSNDDGATWTAVGGTAGLDSNGWKQTRVDLTQFLPGVLKIRWSFISGMPTLRWDTNDEGTALADTWELSPPDWGNPGFAAKLPPTYAEYAGGTLHDEWLESPEFPYPDYYWWWWVEPSDDGFGDTTITFDFKWYPVWAGGASYPFQVYLLNASKIWVLSMNLISQLMHLTHGIPVL
jgi:hypothetical protein